jgi:predicted SprT family Zn-dependent metalloprotease
MPFKSKAQQKWMFMHYPGMAERWAKHTKNIKALPEKVKKKQYKYKIDNKMRGAVGEIDYDKKVIRINKKKAKKRGPGEVLKTIKHEVDHLNHPRMHEKTVYKREKNTPKLPKKTKAKLYSLFNQKKFNNQIKKTFNL